MPDEQPIELMSLAEVQAELRRATGTPERRQAL
jgi:hypothetical protein